MGLGGGDLALLLGTIGAGAASGLTAPQGQKLSSFAGTDVDPTKLLSGAQTQLSSLFSDLLARAESPVEIKTTVPPLPSFVGGGLPMAIAAPAMDPNRLNPALRTSSGFGPQPRSLPGPQGGGGTIPNPPGGGGKVVLDNDAGPNGNQPWNDFPTKGADSDKALAALQLLTQGRS